MIESMRILMLLMEISITDAKRIVHFSRTWSDLRESNDELHCTSEAVARIVAERGFPAAPGDRSDSDFER